MPELTRRYVVMAMATEAPFDVADPDAVFVLKPWKDPAALRAIATYREHCYPELARDLDAWIAAIEAGPSVRGDVGRRNDPHVKPATRPASGRSAKRSPVHRGGARRGHPTVRGSRRRSRRKGRKRR